MLPRSTGLVPFLVVLGCGPSTPEPTEPDTPPSRTSETIVEVIREEPPESVEEPREPALVKGVTARTGEGENPRLRIGSPRENAVVRRGPVNVKLSVTGWPTAPGGPYVAVLVDDQPPIHVDDPSQPVELADLEDGSHLLRAMAVMQNGESIKDAGGFAWATFHLVRRTPNWGFDRRKPFLTVNLPAGRYEGDAAVSIPVDVQVTGVTLGEDGHRVRVEIADVVSAEITELLPHFLRDLPDGPNEVVFQLVDAEGNPVGGVFGRVSRTIVVERSVPEEEGSEEATPVE